MLRFLLCYIFAEEHTLGFDSTMCLVKKSMAKILSTTSLYALTMVI